MTSQTIMLNFSDLKNLSSAEIVEAISSKAAVEVTLSIESCENSEEEVYKTWSTSLFQSYGPSRITEKDLTILFDLFSTTIKELLDKCGHCQNDEQIERLHQFLNYSLELFTWIHSSADEFEANKVTAFLCFGLFSIQSYLVVLSKQASRTNGARKLIEKSLQIHSLILAILASHSKTFLCYTNKTSLGSLISGLCSVGEIVPKLDIKATVETWKCITKLATENVTFGQSGYKIGVDIEWLSKPMSFLIKEIGRNIKTVYTEDSLSEPIQQIEKFLKVTNFYLRLLLNLANYFNHVPFPICEEFIGTCAVVFNPPAYIAKTPVYKAIMDYIGNDLKELMPLAYRNERFFELLLSELCENIHSKEAIHKICLLVMQVIIRKDDPKYINEQLLNGAFKYISQGHLYTPKATYNHFVETLSSLQIRFNDERVKKKLITTILDDNTMQALAAIDIWCTIFILSDGSIRQSYLKFWIDINERFAKFSTNITALHTELLLKNLYTLLPPQEKTEMWNKFNACTLRNERLFLTIGLEAIPAGATKQSIIQHFQSELLGLLNKSNKEKTIENYYTIVKNLKLLKPIDFKNDDIIEMLLQYLEIAMEDIKLYQMVESILDFIAPRIGYIDGNKIQTILNMMNMNISLFGELSTKLCFIGFLKNVSKLSRFEKISEETLKALQSDEEIQRFVNLNEKSDLSKDDTEKYNELWKKIIQNQSMSDIQRKHICHTTKVTTMPMINKTRTNVEDLLESLENNTNRLETEFQCRQLSTANLETIKRVVLKLKGVSKMDL